MLCMEVVESQEPKGEEGGLVLCTNAFGLGYHIFRVSLQADVLQESWGCSTMLQHPNYCQDPVVALCSQ